MLQIYQDVGAMCIPFQKTSLASERCCVMMPGIAWPVVAAAMQVYIRLLARPIKRGQGEV